ncbi:MAG: PQQ-like beta-propeller repeat protein [Deferribacteraceae bacterium]|jgi:outer membrane protein assembly factor BamB|nr:PQQ-like beta-propeller repeat protein [Deferribacteraceae bacterium]
MMRALLTLFALCSLVACNTNNAAKPSTSTAQQGASTQQTALPQTKKIGNISDKGLNEYATVEIMPEVIFDAKSRIRSATLAHNGKIYFGSEKGNFYALDIATKQALWEYSADLAMKTQPAIADNKIIFNAGNSLYILDAENGDELHKTIYPAPDSFEASTDTYTYHDSYVAVSAGIAYYAALDGTIVAVDINSGETLWSLPAETGYIASGINVLDGKLYFIDHSGALTCVDANTREVVFKTQLNGTFFTPMHIADGKIYVSGRSGKVFCIDAASGKVLWASFSHDVTTWFSGGSVTRAGTVYSSTSDEHTLVAYDQNTGEFLRIYPTMANVFTQPILNGENVIVAATNVYASGNSYIMEFDTQNHFKLWQAYIKDSVYSTPAIYEGVLYFGSDSGKIYGIKLH